MRQIDADALKVALFQKHVHDGEELEPMLYYADAVKVIDAAPTIDAIPVEWLEAQIVPYKGDAGDVGFTVHNVTIKNLIRKWQKEQEASADGDRTTD